jgi:hypothetical protein
VGLDLPMSMPCDAAEGEIDSVGRNRSSKEGLVVVSSCCVGFYSI